MRPRSQKNSGFSLIEVMCAILILGIALVALVQGINTALWSSKEAETQTTAAVFAAGQLETLRADSVYIEDGETEGDCGTELSQYQWRQTVSPGMVEGLHEVELRIETASSGKPIYTLKTMIFDPPLEEVTEPKNKLDEKKKRGSRTE